MAQLARETRRDRLGIRLDRELVRARKRAQEPQQLGQRGVGRRPAAEEDRLEPRAVVLLVKLAEQRVDVHAVHVVAAGRRDEVAVAAAVRAEREVDVQVAGSARHTVTRFGRATSSPPQFGHTKSIASPHDRQNVHS